MGREFKMEYQEYADNHDPAHDISDAEINEFIASVYEAVHEHV